MTLLLLFIGPPGVITEFSDSDTGTVIESASMGRQYNFADADSTSATEAFSIVRKSYKTASDTGSIVVKYIPQQPKQISWKTEIALDSSPTALLTNQQFTDVSNYVLESTTQTVKRGRSDEISDIQPSTLTLTVDNTDSRFTPGNPNSPYAGKLNIGTVIRRSAIVDGATFARFTGYIDSVSIPEWVNAGFHKTAVITASDRLARLGHQRAGVMNSMVDYETARYVPMFYWPLDDEDGATYASTMNSARTDPLMVKQWAGSMSFGNGEQLPADTVSTAKFEPIFGDAGYLIAGSDYLEATLTTPLAYGTDTYTLSVWAYLESKWNTGVNNVMPKLVSLIGSNSTITIGIDSNGYYYGSVGATKVLGPLAGSGWSQLTFCTQMGGSLWLQVNGSYFFGPSTPSTPDTLTTVQVGAPWSGSIGNVAIFSPYEVGPGTDLYKAGARGTDGMTASTAMTTIAKYAGIDASEIVCAPEGLTRVGHIPLNGRSRTEVLKDIAKIEGGLLFVDRDGILQFHTRSKRWDSDWVPPDLIINNQEIKDSVEVSYNDEYLINDMTVGKTNGMIARAIDSASQTKHGIYGDSADYRFFNDNECGPRARLKVASYKDPVPRYGAIPICVTTSLMTAQLLALDIGSLIKVTGLTSDAPALNLQWVEGMEEQQNINEYVLTLNTSTMLPTEKIAYARVRIAGTGSDALVSPTLKVAP